MKGEIWAFPGHVSLQAASGAAPCFGQGHLLCFCELGKALHNLGLDRIAQSGAGQGGEMGLGVQRGFCWGNVSPSGLEFFVNVTHEQLLLIEGDVGHGMEWGNGMGLDCTL